MKTPYKTKSIPDFKSETFLVDVIKDGDRPRLVVRADMYMRTWLKNNAKPGDEASMRIELRRPKRTLLQNAFYWVYIDLVSLSSGHTTDEIHTWAKGAFLSQGITEVFGHKVRKVKSTTDLNRSEFCEYMDRIEEATGVPIPDPEPFLGLTWDEYREKKRVQRSNYQKIKAKKIK